MRTIFFLISFLYLQSAIVVVAQETIYPAKEDKSTLFIVNGTIHIGNGQVIANGTVQVNNGKIVSVTEKGASKPQDARVIDATGKHVYPGLILTVTDLGL